MLTFESTHEYYLGTDPSLYYCEEHSSLMITQDHEDRLVISGIDYKTMLQFATKFYQKDLEKSIKEYSDKDAVDKEASEV